MSGCSCRDRSCADNREGNCRGAAKGYCCRSDQVRPGDSRWGAAQRCTGIRGDAGDSWGCKIGIGIRPGCCAVRGGDVHVNDSNPDWRGRRDRSCADNREHGCRGAVKGHCRCSDQVRSGNGRWCATQRCAGIRGDAGERRGGEIGKCICPGYRLAIIVGDYYVSGPRCARWGDCGYMACINPSHTRRCNTPYGHTERTAGSKIPTNNRDSGTT